MRTLPIRLRMEARKAGRLSLVWVFFAFGLPVQAAEITDVADAADEVRYGSYQERDPFDVYFQTHFGMDFDNGKITREPMDRGGVTSENCGPNNARNCLPADELRYNINTARMHFNLELGLFRDLAFTLGWSYVVFQSFEFQYADRVSAENSTIDPNYDVNGDQQVNANDTLFANDFTSRRVGSGPLELGLRWAPLSDLRDVSKPTWVLAFQWSSPWTTTTYNPGEDFSGGRTRPVGDGTHRLTFSTALSKRIGNFGLIGIDPDQNRRGYLDPYFSLSYSYPIPDMNMALDPLTDDNFGAPPSHEATIRGGFEVVALENLRQHRKVSVDLGLISTFYSSGRNYSILTDPLGELTYTEQYTYVGGILGFYAQATEFIRLKAGLTLGYNTAHFLTNENVGRDANQDGQVIPPDQDPQETKDELNPYFCGNSPGDLCDNPNNGGKGQPSYDQVGFRLRDEAHLSWSWFISMMFTF